MKWLAQLHVYLRRYVVVYMLPRELEVKRAALNGEVVCPYWEKREKCGKVNRKSIIDT